MVKTADLYLQKTKALPLTNIDHKSTLPLLPNLQNAVLQMQDAGCILNRRHTSIWDSWSLS